MDIYSKILNEAIDIMDFDSWDDSEQVFKDDIQNKLQNIFVYKATNKYKNCLQIFESDAAWCEKWPAWKGDNNFRNTKVYIEGIAFPLLNDKTVNLDNLDFTVYHGNLNKLFNVILIFPRALKDRDCVNMFAEADIVKCPALDVSECTSLKYMFLNCKSLQTVEPFIGLDNISEATQMLNSTWLDETLDEKTKAYWKPVSYSREKGTPKRWLPTDY